MAPVIAHEYFALDPRRLRVARSVVRVFLLAVLALSLGHCSRPHHSPLRVGLLVWPAYEMAFLARDRGALGDGIELVDSGSPADVVRAFRNGSVDVIAVTLDYALHLRDLGRDARVVLVIDFSEGGDSLILRGDRGGVEGLRGARVGVEPSALGAYVFTRALEQLGGSKEDVSVVPLDIARQEEEFLAGRVDAVVTYEPTRSRLLARGHRELFESSRIPGEIVDVLVASSHAVDEHPAELRRLVRAWLDSVQVFPTLDRSALEPRARRESLTVEEFVEASRGVQLVDLEANRRLLGDPSPGLVALGKRVASTLVACGVLGRAPDEGEWREMLTDRFLPGEPE